jgi:hypothetical protein
MYELVENVNSAADDPVEIDIDEGLHRFGADVSFGGEFREAMERLFFGVRVDDQDAVVFPERPVLSFDLHAGLRGDLVERVGAFGGFLDFPGALFCETQKTDVSSHMFFELKLFWNNSIETAGAACSSDPTILSAAASKGKGTKNPPTVGSERRASERRWWTLRFHQPEESHVLVGLDGVAVLTIGGGQVGDGAAGKAAEFLQAHAGLAFPT